MKTSMFKLSAASGLFLCLVSLFPAQARAQAASNAPVVTSTGTGSGAGLGVGAAAFIGGLAGVDVVYDLPRFHIEGLLAFSSLDNGAANSSVTRFQFGARGWYHLHTGTNADFSVGGGFGVRTSSGGAGERSTTATLIEPGMQARVFLTPNFTLNATAGLSLAFGDSVDGRATGFELNAQLLGGIGFTYFFR